MKSQMRTLLLSVATLVLLGGSLYAEGRSQSYIVILKERSGVTPDIDALGGTIESRQEEQLVVTIPPASLAALRADAKVRYVERVGGTPSEGEDSLIGVPADPTPGPASNARFTPHALGSTPWASGDYVYDGAGNIVSIGTDTYAYDGVQRLRQSATRGTPETYTYDGFGNMTTKTNNGLAQQVPSVEVGTNRYTGAGYSYNEIGAMVTGASYFFTYDSLGQPLSKKYNNDSTTQEYYIYTPGDERIGVQRGTWWTWSVRDEGGKVLRQFRSSTIHPTDPSLWLEDFVWRDGLLLGSQRPPELGGRRHYHLDHLGTPRLVTAENGQRISLHDYFPFGDEATPVWQEVAAGYDREDPMKFTGHERDYAWGMGAEDGHAVDYMVARYFNPTLSRFLSPDPVYGHARGAQSWNRYAYTFNNPMRYVDPSGRAPVLVRDANGFRFAADDDDDGVADGAAPTSGSGQPTRTPAQGQQPGTTQTFPNGDGKTVRTYGPDGKATTDVDYGHDHGAGDPHVHDWDWSNKKPRAKDGRAPKPGEIPEPSKSTSIGPRRPGAATIITGVILAAVGTAVILMTGGVMTLRPTTAGVVLVPRGRFPTRSSSGDPHECPDCI